MGAKDLIEQKIKAKKVMMFSKTSCPFCTMAKEAFKKYLGDVLSQDDYEIMEIEKRDDCGAIQDELLQMTGARSVPRVFINGKFVGGGSEIKAMDGNGELKKALTAA